MDSFSSENFLKEQGNSEDAFSKFWKADQLNPNIAVTKQQIGNFFVENGRIIEAFPFFLQATRLEPEEPHIIIISAALSTFLRKSSRI